MLNLTVKEGESVYISGKRLKVVKIDRRSVVLESTDKCTLYKGRSIRRYDCNIMLCKTGYGFNKKLFSCSLGFDADDNVEIWREKLYRKILNKIPEGV